MSVRLVRETVVMIARCPGRADTRGHRRPSPTAGGSKDVHYRFEVVTVPVSDVNRARDFYQRLGWRLDADVHFEDGGREVQVTPPGSACSVHFGTGGTSAAPGSAQGLELAVDDIDTARAELAGHGAEVSEVFHTDAGKRVAGADPEHRSYLSL